MEDQTTYRYRQVLKVIQKLIKSKDISITEIAELYLREEDEYFCAIQAHDGKNRRPDSEVQYIADSLESDVDDTLERLSILYIFLEYIASPGVIQLIMQMVIMLVTMLIMEISTHIIQDELLEDHFIFGLSMIACFNIIIVLLLIIVIHD